MEIIRYFWNKVYLPVFESYLCPFIPGDSPPTYLGSLVARCWWMLSQPMFVDIEYSHSRPMNKPWVSNTPSAVPLLCISLWEQNTQWGHGSSHDWGFAYCRHQEPGLKKDRFTRSGKDGIVDASSPHLVQHFSLCLMAQVCIQICVSLSILKKIGQGWVPRGSDLKFFYILHDKFWKGSRKNSNSEARWESNDCYKFLCQVSGL